MKNSGKKKSEKKGVYKKALLSIGTFDGVRTAFTEPFGRNQRRCG
jgi:hypothetical protein